MEKKQAERKTENGRYGGAVRTQAEKVQRSTHAAECGAGGSGVLKALSHLRTGLILLAAALILLTGVKAADMVTCSKVHAEGVTCRKIGFITREERYRDEEGKLLRVHEFTDVQDGDILISMSTHTLGWRHGHAAIVTDAERGITLEAALWGEPSSEMRMSHWGTYANAVHLRVREDEAERALAACGIVRAEGVTAAAQLGRLAAEFAEKHEKGVNYGLLTGIPQKSPVPEKLKKTQCAHIVWYAYNHFGIDLDSDGSWLVTPRDIARSDALTAVEKFGDYSIR